MTDKELLVVLPERDQMIAALVGVTGEPQIVDDLYPKICDILAGQLKTPCGICLALIFAIHEYTAGMNEDTVTNLYMRVSDFVKALTPDGVVREQALADWEEIMRRTRKVV